MTAPFDNSLLDADYEGVRFPVSEFSVQGGHSSAKHRSYRRRGADIEWTGQEPYSGTMTVPMFDVPQLNDRYGERMFPEHMRTLIDKFESTPIGEMVHPSLGQIQVHIDSWPHKAGSDNRSGVPLEVHWTEHNASATVSLDYAGVTPVDSAANAQVQVDSVDAEAEAGGFEGYFAMAATWANALSLLDAASLSYSATVAAIGTMDAAVKGNLDLPSLAVSEAASVVLGLERLFGVTASLREQYLPGESKQQTYIVPSTMPAWQVAQAVYGDISKDTLILAANPIADPSAIPTGTQLVILPSS